MGSRAEAREFFCGLLMEMGWGKGLRILLWVCEEDICNLTQKMAEKEAFSDLKGRVWVYMGFGRGKDPGILINSGSFERITLYRPKTAENAGKDDEKGCFLGPWKEEMID